MEPHILDPDWLADHHALICAWSPFTVLWSLHHDLVIGFRTPLVYYRSIVQHYGFPHPNPTHDIALLIVQYEPLAVFTDTFLHTYQFHDMSHLAHSTHTSSRVAAYTDAMQIIRDLSVLLQTHAP